MADRYTSRVFVAGRALYDRLCEQAWTPHPLSGEAPTIGFSDERPDEGAEKVAVRLHASPDATIEWRRLSPAGADERLRFEIVIEAFQSVESSVEVWDRLSALTDIVWGVFYDTAANTVQAIDFDGEELSGLPILVRPSVWPTETGFVGECLIAVELNARI